MFAARRAINAQQHTSNLVVQRTLVTTKASASAFAETSFLIAAGTNQARLHTCNAIFSKNSRTLLDAMSKKSRDMAVARRLPSRGRDCTKGGANGICRDQDF